MLDFSDPYFEATQALLVKKGSGISGLEDLSGKSLAVQEGTTGAIYAEENAPEDTEIRTFEDLALLDDRGEDRPGRRRRQRQRCAVRLRADQPRHRGRDRVQHRRAVRHRGAARARTTSCWPRSTTCSPRRSRTARTTRSTRSGSATRPPSDPGRTLHPLRSHRHGDEPPQARALSRGIQYAVLGVLVLVAALAANWPAIGEAFFEPVGRGSAGPGDLHDRAEEHHHLHGMRVHLRPVARARPRADAALVGRSLPLVGYRVHRAVPRPAGAGGLHLLRLRPADRPSPATQFPAARSARSPLPSGWWARPTWPRPSAPASRRSRRDSWRRPARWGCRTVARDVLGCDPAGFPDHPAAADQRAHPAHQGLVTGVRPRPEPRRRTS